VASSAVVKPRTHSLDSWDSTVTQASGAGVWCGHSFGAESTAAYKLRLLGDEQEFWTQI